MLNEGLSDKVASMWECHVSTTVSVSIGYISEAVYVKQPERFHAVLLISYGFWTSGIANVSGKS